MVLTAIDSDVIKTYVELGMGVGIIVATCLLLFLFNPWGLALFFLVGVFLGLPGIVLGPAVDVPWRHLDLAAHEREAATAAA